MKIVTINSISLDLDEEWELRENSESIKAWYNKFGDRLSINFFLKKPNLPEDIADIQSLRNLYRESITQENGAIVEVEKDYIHSLLAVKTIFKFVQDPAGFTFIGSYTIPRRDFSFVLKVQCLERGITGLRESVILDKALGVGLVDIETKKGWFFDPYDPDFKAPILSNIADREEYDDRFPKHPLSRARKTMKMVKDNIKPKVGEQIMNP